MRLHHLTIQAFGPFGGIVDIDFDELNAAGQFLISGATGSGKTSILDAVCFALYGEVPGERQRAKHLRSDHAAADAEPRVTLTLTVADRLVRISRSPAWERPKRRGAGLTLQQASVRLEQQVDGEWQCLATRLDEAGLLINTWLGMTPVQFTQVALLPQGGFQTFLQSPTAARQAVLQRLFRTDRFERVERWFGEFRRSLNRSRAEALHGVDVITHRLAEAAGMAEPPGVDAGIDHLADWARQCCAANDDALAASYTAREEAANAHHAAARLLAEAAALVDALDRAASAERVLTELEESAPAFAEDLQALRAHERAGSLAPLIRATAEASVLAEDAERRAMGALIEAGVPHEDRAHLEDLSVQARRTVQEAEQCVALEDRLQTAQAERRDAEQVWHDSGKALEALRALSASIPQQQKAMADELQGALGAQLDLASVALELEVVRQRRDAAQALETVQRDLADKIELRRASHDHVQDLRQEYQDAREARIEAMASELAVGLVAGCSCPVCGSTAHPAPAAPGGGVGRRAEERALKKYDTAVVKLAALDDVIAADKARAEALAQTAQGVPLADWEEIVSSLQSRRSALVEQASQVESLRARAAGLVEQGERAQTEIDELVRTEAQEHARFDLLTDKVEDLRTALAVALGDLPDAATYLKQAQQRATAIQAAQAMESAYREAAAAASQQRAALDVQAVSLGFASGDAAEQALLEERIAAAIAEHEQDRAQARVTALAVLQDPTVIASAHLPRPALEPLEADARFAEQALAEAQAAVRVAERRRERTATIAQELTQELRRYRPLEEKAERVSALSALLEGTGADNRLRMRLSAFVLAERLRQVVDAANARLEVISEGRYVLAYREERGAGDSRGGLSLSILDEWTGVRRDPSTLSGGETFVVSLCLALGLADTVADESGGLRIDTLFIDEGFGSLDAQTLDSVIDILGQLSQGGRVTGVVSHVFEMRERMPAVLEVVPSKSGSTVRRATA